MPDGEKNGKAGVKQRELHSPQEKYPRDAVSADFERNKYRGNSLGLEPDLAAGSEKLHVMEQTLPPGIVAEKEEVT
jgi:hypothetical protein